MTQRSVMVIGIDAATLDLVRPWAERGLLPNLKRFLDAGAVGPLRSTLPVMSPAAWSTFATGTNPGKHGIIDFCQLPPDGYRPRFVTAADRRGEAFWEIAARQGVRGGVINVPITFPPRPFDGFIVAGLNAPGVNRRLCSPPETLDELLELSPDYAIDVDLLDSGGSDVKLLFLERALAAIDARRKAAVGLYRRRRPPLFVVAFVETDRLCHYFWRHHELLQAGAATGERDRRLGEAILLGYQRIDQAVGELLDEAGPQTDVLILSDHGAGPQTKGLNMRKALAAAGLLVEARPGALGRAAAWGVRAFAQAAPASLKSKLKTHLARLTNRAAGVVAVGGIDMPRTQAYPTGDSAAVWVNLKGRQPQGVVEPGGEYEAVRDRVIAALAGLTDPQTRQRVARAVHRREEVWSGPCLDQLPDVVMEADLSYETKLLSESRTDEVFFPLPDPLAEQRLFHVGGHRPDGLVMAMGPHVRQGEVRGATVADVPATALALLGCAIPDDFDGRCLWDLLTEDVALHGRTAAPAPQAPAEPAEDVLSEEDRAAVEKRLKGLGYL